MSYSTCPKCDGYVRTPDDALCEKHKHAEKVTLPALMIAQTYSEDVASQLQQQIDDAYRLDAMLPRHRQQAIDLDNAPAEFKLQVRNEPKRSRQKRMVYDYLKRIEIARSAARDTTTHPKQRRQQQREEEWRENERIRTEDPDR